MSFDSQVFEYEEILEMYDEICERLKDRADLLQVFMNLVKKGDTNYETESTTSSEEYSDSEVVDETITLKQEDNGHISID